MKRVIAVAIVRGGARDCGRARRLLCENPFSQLWGRRLIFAWRERPNKSRAGVIWPIM